MIEENGPVRVVIRATGSHRDAAGNAYMNYTVRMHFYRGKSVVKAVVSLRNADLGASNGFATAYKGFDAYEWRVPLSLEVERRVPHSGRMEAECRPRH